LDWGFTGALPACVWPVAWDLSKSQPYDVYAKMDFDIPVGKYRRLLCSVFGAHGRNAPVIAHHATMFTRYARKAPIKTDDYKVTPPPRAEMKNSMEALNPPLQTYSPKAITFQRVKHIRPSKPPRESLACIW
jgi:NADH-quinone oxidoreductase subunit D